MGIRRIYVILLLFTCPSSCAKVIKLGIKIPSFANEISISWRIKFFTSYKFVICFWHVIPTWNFPLGGFQNNLWNLKLFRSYPFWIIYRKLLLNLSNSKIVSKFYYYTIYSRLFWVIWRISISSSYFFIHCWHLCFRLLREKWTKSVHVSSFGIRKFHLVSFGLSFLLN